MSFDDGPVRPHLSLDRSALAELPFQYSFGADITATLQKYNSKGSFYGEHQAFPLREAG